MSFKAMDHSVNIIAYEKNNKKYGMCCAWSMMVDYDKIICLLGSQSVTGRNLEKGDIVGVSSLCKKQKKIAECLGEEHSDEMDKFSNIVFYQKESAILIPNSCTEMICEVLEIYNLPLIEEDNLIYLKIVEHKETKQEFLHMEDF